MIDPLIFKHSKFTLFWLGHTSATVASQMLIVAVGWQIYELTHSPLSLGLVGLVQFMPQFVLAFVAGPVADRYNRKRIVIVCQLIDVTTAVVLATSSFGGWVTPEIIYACAFTLGATRAFSAPTLQAILPGLIESSLLAKAIAWSSAVRNLAVILGPPIGGLIYVLGSGAVYASGAIFFLLAGALITMIKIDHAARAPEPVTLASVLGGFSYVRTHPVILGAITLDLFAVLLGGATALLPIYASDILHTGPVGLGILRAAPAIGALAVSLYLARKPLKRRVGHIMFVSVAVFGVATTVFALSESLVLSALALAISGAADMVSVVIRSSLVQLETPDHMRGRVSAVNSIFIGTSNQLGEFRSGVTAAWLGTVPAVVIGGIGTLIVVAAGMRLFPSLRQRDTFTTEHPAHKP